MGYMDLAGLVSPFLPMLLNCLEDARVNCALFDALPGTKIMFDATTQKIFRDGVEGMQDGKWCHVKWNGRSLNDQAMIGVFCMASGYTFDAWIDPFVVTCLADDQLVDLVGQLDNAANVDSVFSLSFPILARLRELGFLRNPETDPEDDFVPPYDETSTEPDPSQEEDDADGTEGDDSGEESGEFESGSETTKEDEEAGSGGSDLESPDLDDDGDDSGSTEADAGKSEGEEELTDESAEDGGDRSESGSEGSETDSSDSAGGTGSDGSSAGAAGTGADDGPVEDEVSEEDDGADAPESGEASESDGADGLRDGDRDDSGSGDRSGDEDLDGPDGSDSGDEDSDEPGDSVDADGDGPGGADGESSEDTDDPGVAEPESPITVDGEKVRPVKPDLPWGTADEVELVIHVIGEHEHDDEEGHAHAFGAPDEDEEGDQMIVAVMISDKYFEQPSGEVVGVDLHTDASGYFESDFRRKMNSDPCLTNDPSTVEPSPALINTVVSRARVVFADNLRARHERGLRRGHIHSPSLGIKAPVGDYTFFQQKRMPGRTDYFVGIGIDVSGSTFGDTLELSKRVAFAEAEMLNMLSIPFCMYAHSGHRDYGRGGILLDLLEIKSPDEIWNDVTRLRLTRVAWHASNLDGHTIQAYRKIMQSHRAKTKILHYYTDGAMPMENYDEELEILRDEIKTYRRLGMHLVGVGIGTDSPREHGLDTVEVNSQEDIMSVILDLEKRLTKR
jgi:hypothetical protein